MAQTNPTEVRAEASKAVAVLTGPDYQAKFRSTLPPGVNLERFTAVVVRAVQEDPGLLDPQTDKATLFLACQHAAQAGLLPDKREGALVKYGNKVQFLPMIAGLRKRLAGAGFDMRAEVIYKNDDFSYTLGDEPKLSHTPAPLGKERGEIIGAYAVATSFKTGEKYREVMSVEQLDAVQRVSRGTGPWTGPFKTEMQRKTVARRCMKQLPIDDRSLNDLLDIDDRNYDFQNAARDTSASETAKATQAEVRGKKNPDATRPDPPPASPDEPVYDAEFTQVGNGDDPVDGEAGADEIF